MNGVVSTAPVTSGGEATKNGDEERAKKRARTDDTDDEIVEGMLYSQYLFLPISMNNLSTGRHYFFGLFPVLNPNVRKYRPPKFPTGSVMPADSQPPGTMKLRGHNAEVSFHLYSSQLWNTTVVAASRSAEF